ncbi:hypothetical protein [Paenibacillus spongiae]|uniref:PilZ domain-containing protein n=1 Tax=Paenibacillus spongiae TaxID=2909671 RepID=A0ABY5S8H0_9BACL|nr:hypothetical protein [Paenibacillus spongiae]UVI30216.1 hypothetical protein L1F29_33445 [Paenibacillus spongiae]
MPADIANNGGLKARIKLDLAVRTGHWPMPESMTLRLSGSIGVIHECPVDCDSFTVPVSEEESIWIRAELWSELQGIRTLVAFTNPIYFERLKEALI